MRSRSSAWTWAGTTVDRSNGPIFYVYYVSFSRAYSSLLLLLPRARSLTRRSVHLRVLDGSSYGPEQQELALESLLEFTREPALMIDVYINYDCDVQCTNLFETICHSLSTHALPRDGMVRGDSQALFCMEEAFLKGVRGEFDRARGIFTGRVGRGVEYVADINEKSQCSRAAKRHSACDFEVGRLWFSTITRRWCSLYMAIPCPCPQNVSPAR